MLTFVRRDDADLDAPLIERESTGARANNGKKRKPPRRRKKNGPQRRSAQPLVRRTTRRTFARQQAPQVRSDHGLERLWRNLLANGSVLIPRNDRRTMNWLQSTASAKGYTLRREGGRSRMMRVHLNVRPRKK